jgi:prepilin-type N-terminal cleavage/methylation domain-containing protein
MKSITRKSSFAVPAPASPSRTEKGFSLIELLVATAVFVLVTGAAFNLFMKQQKLESDQKGQAALNVGLRNALTQLQIDLANAGAGYFVGANVPSWPVGVTIINNPPGSGCYTGNFVYSASCFDVLNIIMADPNTPPIHVDGNGTTCSSTTSSIAFGDPATVYSGNPPVSTALTAAQTAAYFHSGDQLLFLTSTGSQISTIVLTADGGVAGGKVQLQHNPSNSNGTNSPSNDPLGITNNANNKLGTQFCKNDWILKLAPVTYEVDTSNPNDPKLMRVQNANAAEVMDQVIGFKVGAAIWNAPAGTVSAQYNYDASTYTNVTPGDEAYNFTLVRSLRISLIGRTPPSTDPAYNFLNSFDQGPYQIQGSAVVVNPRNLSMNDN